MPVSDPSTDLLVVGGGPAGISAARSAAAAGMNVVLADERPTLGGQIYKQPGPGFTVTDPAAMDGQFRYGRSLIDSLDGSGVDVRLRTSVVAVEGRRVFLVTDGSAARELTARRLVLAPGAHDRPVAFPGWTLPGVITAGGLQTLAKTQRVLPGERTLFAGSGPVALAFPAQLGHYGADIVTALEAGPAPRPGDFLRIARAARGNAVLLRDAARYRAMLLRQRIPLRYGRIVVRAEGDGRVERVVHAAVDADWRVIAGTEETVEVDVLCVGYGFVASLELMRLAGCDFDYQEDLGGHVVRRDEWHRTSVDGVYAAGDGAGVEGSFVAIDEGHIAGLAAAMDAGAMSEKDAAAASAAARRRLARRRALNAATKRLYRVGPGIFELPADDTVICRCEAVRRRDLAPAIASTDDINLVKAYTRAGMGPCQGRICQRQVSALIARHHGRPVEDVALATPRMPVRPVPIGALADPSIESPTLFLSGETTGADDTAPPEVTEP
ncbi:NAD(P)/FAD-dependent oxidoreductase [Actinomadura sp. DC4]|uniref:FAD/NAD(P)-dependent oxidoreductase n=1 Tax=Actinomadura sp. DC4 TaxID=3055069 RepID=UPI0025B236C7|nr:NAD(P)/FAD-dependent oxidoreductase [Actinomadura sp. DC4]MDN3359396.1 NAD(P)/FAD-dependent oxidoreductase [Actinomadura sp. DC4]